MSAGLRAAPALSRGGWAPRRPAQGWAPRRPTRSLVLDRADADVSQSRAGLPAPLCPLPQPRASIVPQTLGSGTAPHNQATFAQAQLLHCPKRLLRRESCRPTPPVALPARHRVNADARRTPSGGRRGHGRMNATRALANSGHLSSGGAHGAGKGALLGLSGAAVAVAKELRAVVH